MFTKSAKFGIWGRCVGGLFFVGSQAWEWYHFIHGTHYGSVLTADGWAVVDYVNEGKDLILKFGRGVIVDGAAAQSLFDGATATMQGANLIENEYYHWKKFSKVDIFILASYESQKSIEF